MSVVDGDGRFLGIIPPHRLGLGGALIAADLMAGQVEDRRVEPGPWRPVRACDHGLAQLTGSPAPPVRVVDELPERPFAAFNLCVASLEPVVARGERVEVLGRGVS